MFPLIRFRVKGASMEPAFVDGDGVLVFRWAYIKRKPRPEDVAVVKNPYGDLILKRIEKTDGDLVWLKGDNRTESIDSRTFGPLAVRNVIGKAIYRY